MLNLIKLIAMDLDGTLLNERKQITPRTEKVLRQAADMGMELVPATGRPLCGVPKEVRALPGVHYILTTNGGGIYENRSGECIVEEGMEPEPFLEMLERLLKLEVMPDAFVKGESYMSRDKVCLIDEMAVTEEMKEYIRSSRTCKEDLIGYLRDRNDVIQKLTINFAKNPDGTFRDWEKAAAVVAQYPAYRAVSGGFHNLEVTDCHVSKGTGLCALGRLCGIEPEEMIAFGDSGNDTDMLMAAGIGVAMENGEEEVKRMADYVTVSNEEEGVAAALEHLLNDTACADFSSPFRNK